MPLEWSSSTGSWWSQSQRDDPESRGNFLFVRLSGLVIHCPTEWDSAGENSSWASQNPKALPNSICSGSFDFLPLLQQSGKTVRRLPTILCSIEHGGALPAKSMSISLADLWWTEDFRGPLVANGSSWGWNQLSLAPHSGWEGDHQERVRMAKVRVCRRERRSLSHSSAQSNKGTVGETHS